MRDFLFALVRRPDGTPRAAFWAVALFVAIVIVGLIYQLHHGGP
jgi:hypothetical protein